MKKIRVEKLKSGNYRARIQIEGHRYSRTGASKEEARNKIYEICLGIEEEKRVPLTVGKAIDQYIAEREKTLSPYTLKGYNTIRKNYLQDLMGINISDLKQSDIQKAVLLDQARGKSAKTIKNAHGLLTATLSEFRPKMVVKTKMPKKTKKKEIVLPNEDEMKKIWQMAKGDTYELPILLASWLGLRMSEVRGLKFSDIENNVLHVQRARIRVKGADLEKPPKTEAGDRFIPLPEPIKKLIDARSKKKDDDWICPFSISAINQGFIRVCKKAGVEPCRFHDLRHFAASEALALGVPDKYAMKRMGHATENMLKNVYQHTMEAKEKDFSGVIDSHLEALYNDVKST